MKFADVPKIIPVALSALAVTLTTLPVKAQSKWNATTSFADMSSAAVFVRFAHKLDSSSNNSINMAVKFGESMDTNDIPKGYREMCLRLSKKMYELIEEFEAFCKTNNFTPIIKTEITEKTLYDIRSIQYNINKQIVPKTDFELYKKIEVWVASKYTKAGDCEDYTMTKLLHLLALGIPRQAMSIAIGSNLFDQSGMLHAVLLVTLHRNGVPFTLVLDNVVDEVMLLTEAEHLELKIATTQKVTEWKKIKEYN